MLIFERRSLKYSVSGHHVKRGGNNRFSDLFEQFLPRNACTCFSFSKMASVCCDGRRATWVEIPQSFFARIRLILMMSKNIDETRIETFIYLSTSYLSTSMLRSKVLRVIRLILLMSKNRDETTIETFILPPAICLPRCCEVKYCEELYMNTDLGVQLKMQSSYVASLLKATNSSCIMLMPDTCGII